MRSTFWLCALYWVLVGSSEIVNKNKRSVLLKELDEPYHRVKAEKTVRYPVVVRVINNLPYRVPRLIPVRIEKTVRVPVKIPVPVPFPVYKKIKVPVKVPVDHPVPYGVIKPFPVVVEKRVPYVLQKKVMVPVKEYVQVFKPVPVPVPIEKKVPVFVERKVPVPAGVDRPSPRGEISYPYHRKEGTHVVKKEIINGLNKPGFQMVSVNYDISRNQINNLLKMLYGCEKMNTDNQQVATFHQGPMFVPFVNHYPLPVGNQALNPADSLGLLPPPEQQYPANDYTFQAVMK